MTIYGSSYIRRLPTPAKVMCGVLVVWCSTRRDLGKIKSGITIAVITADHSLKRPLMEFIMVFFQNCSADMTYVLRSITKMCQDFDLSQVGSIQEVLVLPSREFGHMLKQMNMTQLKEL